MDTSGRSDPGPPSGAPFALTILGSGTGLPDAARGPAGLLLETPTRAFLVDGGSGTLRTLASLGHDPLKLDGVFYSHRHPDHCADLIPLLFARRIARVTDPLPVYAADGFGPFLDHLAMAWGPWVVDAVDLHLLTRGPPQERSITPELILHHAAASHGRGAIHLGFSRGPDHRSPEIVFSGDTGPSQHLAQMARGADLLVVECASPSPAEIPGHLAPEDVHALLHAARPRQAWLTHLYPSVDPDRALAIAGDAGIPVRRAEDGDRWPGPKAPTT